MKDIKKPVLRLECDRKPYGVIGEPTMYKDGDGNALFVGDIVELYYRKKYNGISVVVRSENILRGINKSFVMGIEWCCDQESGDLGEWNVRRIKGYYDLVIDEKIIVEGYTEFKVVKAERE